jgi:hypothetical protein
MFLTSCSPIRRSTIALSLVVDSGFVRWVVSGPVVATALSLRSALASP